MSSRAGRHGLTAIEEALRTLCAARAQGGSEEAAQLDARLTLMATMADERVVRDQGPLALRILQEDAASVLSGRHGTPDGRRLLSGFDEQLTRYGIRPATSGALLTVLLVLDCVGDRALGTAVRG